MTNTEAAELPIHPFLRERLRDTFGNVLSRLAESCDTTPSQMAKWVSEVPERRRTPSPGSCMKIAGGLGVPLDYVLALAGHRAAPAEDPSDEPALGVIIGILRKRWHELQEPEQRVIQATIQAVAGGARRLTNIYLPFLEPVSATFPQRRIAP